MQLNVRAVKLSLFALVVLSIGIAIGVSFSSRHKAQPNVAFGDFIRDVDAGKIEEVTISGQMVSGIYRDNGTGFYVYVPADQADLVSKLLHGGVRVFARR
jgi:cell division protease FtsH